MDNLNLNKILDREKIYNNIKDILLDFEKTKKDLLVKRGIYIYGNPGSGKTYFINKLMKDINYDTIIYDASDIRNKSIIEGITKYNMSDRNIINLFHGKQQPIAIIMDEIDGMNNGDKGGINSLIKLIRPKKTKKQKLEDITYNPIVCIGNYHIDKKIKELMKVCYVIELKTPTDNQIKQIINNLMPNIQNHIIDNVISYIQGDLRKINALHKIYKNNNNFISDELINTVFQKKNYNEDTKIIVKKLLNNKYIIDDHITLMNETDRTIIALLWHENVIDLLNKLKLKDSLKIYLKILDNICFSDYIDRITFQKQIWQFNEMSSLIKTFYTNYLYHENTIKKYKYNPSEVRFTKVLTKYSTEFNNYTFIQNICQQLNLDKKDLLSFFCYIKKKYNDEEEILQLLENYEINKLDISRMYRFIDKFVNYENNTTCNDEIVEEIVE
tara:strand:- start:45 stop:1370 length:1326 start_codon:yes stop_codon:yes gene_type:complete